MTTFRSILGSIVCISLLPIVSTGIANAGGDVAKPFKDSTNNSAVKRGAMTLQYGGTEQNLTTSSSLLPILLPPKKYCALSTKQVMDLDPKNYRWHNEDVNDTFVDPDFGGLTLQSATLCITYKDVDLTSAFAYTPELDVVQFGNTTIGVLPGNNGETLTKCWNVKSRLQKNTHTNIPFIVNVDAAHDTNYWAVYLHRAVLSTCHANLTIPPWPPIIIPPYRY
ncbi:MAG: hypothetical protein GXP18_05980 [Gammaproteobacteria bacterium]|nr:hypothetical protein [Gammaproteobacteria bacterium]